MLIGQFFNSILPGEIFYFSRQNFHPVQMGGLNIHKMVNFVPKKNAFIFQGNHNNEEDDGKYNEPREEQEIGN
tara:strand:- start:332 stop:550 length:219 start_codon:yes stop_codon:yes gene_type:complete